MILLEERRNSITYDDNWQSVTEPEVPVIHAPDENDSFTEYSAHEEAPAHRPPSRQLLITVQLVICALIAFAAFILKSMGGEWYASVREWYDTQLNSSAVFEAGDAGSLSSLFGKSSADEV